MSIQYSRILQTFVVATLFVSFGNTQGSERKVKMKDLPKAVQRTVQQQSEGATLSGLSKEVEHGKTYYEAELKVNGHSKDILIDSAGSIVEVEEEIAIAALPPSVRTAIEAKAGRGRIIKVESITKNNTLVAYEAQVNTAGKKSEIKVGPEGNPIEAEENSRRKDPAQKTKKP